MVVEVGVWLGIYKVLKEFKEIPERMAIMQTGLNKPEP